MIAHLKSFVGRYHQVNAFSQLEPLAALRRISNAHALIVCLIACLVAVSLNLLTLSAMAQTNSAPAYTWTTFAGRPLDGSADGIGSAAEFDQPSGVAVDTNGNIFVTDFMNNTIREITSAGVVTTIAGFPRNFSSADGVGSAARFYLPEGIAVDNGGNLYIADSGNFTIRKITPVGTNWVVSTIAGLSRVGGNVDGTNSGALFIDPDAIAIDAGGNLYVTDGEAHSLRKIAPVGTNWVVTTLASGFSSPSGVAVDGATNIFVTDISGEVVWEVTQSGAAWSASIIAGSMFSEGGTDGTGSAARFDEPQGITVDNAGTVYVSDGLGSTLRKLTPVGSSWQVTTLAGTFASSGGVDGTGSNARFNFPQGLATDAARNIYIADSGNNAIRKCTSAGVVRTLAGQSSLGGQDVDGVGMAARLNDPDGLAIDASGTVFFTEQFGHTVRQVSSAGQVSSIAGFPGVHGTNDGIGNNARFFQPAGIVVNSVGNMYVADFGNNTIRLITSAGVVTTIAGTPQFDGQGNPVGGSADGIGTAARFNGPQGVTVDGNGRIYVADAFNETIRKITPTSRFNPLTGKFTTSYAVTTIAGQVGQIATLDGTNTAAHFYSPCGITADASGRLYVIGSDAAVRLLTPVDTNWIVTTIAKLPNFFANPDGGITLDGSGNIFVTTEFSGTISKISPVGTNWVVTVIGGNSGIGSSDGAGNDARFSQPVDVVADAKGNVYVADSQNNTIRLGVFTAYNPASPMAYAPPPMTSSLTVTLTPPEANGQWRFPWEIAWRSSGQAANNLVSGNYPVEFRTLPGWLALPPSLTVAVSGDVALTNQYLPTDTTVDTNSGGALTVTLGPSPPAGAGWRFLGDTTAFYSSGFTTNLNAGIYLIEFASVSGRTKPPNSSVQVFPGQPTLLAENYLIATSAPSQVELPFPVPTNQINDVVNYPFGFDGQLQSDTGYGSGVAVQANVVLTAAHVVFNDQTLAYVSQAYWYFRQEAGLFAPEPQAARGWYLLSGYATQRTNDLEIYSPDTSTPQSRNLDVAALYFLSPVAGGGYAGYLPSDESPNQWLSGSSLKMLVGYPVDGSMFGNADILPGLMYQINPQPYPLALSTDPVANQRVYTAPWFLSYPGNSGGPVYAQFNGYYYPAGVYLGTLFNGSQPYASLVLGIDGQVVNLITNASSLGDSGTNNTGGGVVTVIPNQNVSASNPGYMQWHFSPPAVVVAGAAWRLQGDANYSSSTNYTRAVTATNAVVVEFKPVAGWNLPANQAISVSPGQVTVYNASYTVTNPMLVATATGIGITGTTNTMYRIDRSTSLVGGTWIPVSTNRIMVPGVNMALPMPTNGVAGYYRAVWLP